MTAARARRARGGVAAFVACCAVAAGTFAVGAAELTGPGDFRQNYESAAYETRSKSLAARRGVPADLYALLAKPPLGLPPPASPAHNPPTRAGIALGRRLFFDRRLSLNDTMSCALCHVPEMGFAHNELTKAVGLEGRSVRRNAPSLLNVAYKTRLFHDGRETALETQAWTPLLARNEMGNPSIGWLLEKLRKIRDYDGLFEAAFDGRGPTLETVGMALAQYQRALLAAASPFDRWRYAGERDALDAEQRRGFEVFTGKGGCVACHLIGERDALFTDNLWHNTGVGYRSAMRKPPPTVRVQLAPGVATSLPASVVRSVTRQQPQGDVGLYELTLNPHDRWKYITPTLRNVALTAPYMHNGELRTLAAVVDFYDRGGEPNELLDPLIRPLGLAPAEKKALVAFMRALTGGNVDTLISDAFAAPVGELQKDDPFWANENPGAPNPGSPKPASKASEPGQQTRQRTY